MTDFKSNNHNIWANGSVLMGGIGIIADCCFCTISNLPGGIFLGVAGIAAAALSKKGKPFTKQAVFGLSLSIISVVIGLVMFAIITYSLYLMQTDPEVAELARQIYQIMEEQMKSLGK